MTKKNSTRKMIKGVRIEMNIDQVETIADSDVAKRCAESPGGVIFLQPIFTGGDYHFRAIYLEKDTALAMQEVMRKIQGVKIL